MSYSKLAESDLKEGISAVKEAIKVCQDLMEKASANPDIKSLQRVAKSGPKEIHKLERDLEKLKKALTKNSRA